MVVRVRPLTARRAVTVLELLIVTVIVGILLAILSPALSRARESARATQCRNNLRQFGIGSRGGSTPPKETVRPEFICPSDGGAHRVQNETKGRTNYAVCAGDGTGDNGFWTAHCGVEGVRDGLSNTFDRGEQDSDPVDPQKGWVDFPMATCRTAINSRDARGRKHIDGFRSRHPAGANFLMLNGAVRFVSENIDLGTYRALATVNGGEVVREF